MITTVFLETYRHLKKSAGPRQILMQVILPARDKRIFPFEQSTVSDDAGACYRLSDCTPAGEATAFACSRFSRRARHGSPGEALRRPLSASGFGRVMGVVPGGEDAPIARIVEALNATFGDNDLTVARRQLRQATDSALLRWTEIVEAIEIRRAWR